MNSNNNIDPGDLDLIVPPKKVVVVFVAAVVVDNHMMIILRSIESRSFSLRTIRVSYMKI